MGLRHFNIETSKYGLSTTSMTNGLWNKKNILQYLSG